MRQALAFPGSQLVGAGGYESLNRPTTKAYTDGTPTVTYHYGEDLSGGLPNYPKGRLTSVLVAGGTTVQFNRFDAAGRTLRHTQTILGAATSPYIFSYHYNPGGLMDQITYPSGRLMTTTFDGAGRVGTLSGQSFGITTNYAGSPDGQPYIHYAPHGAISQMYLNKPAGGQWSLNEVHGYNSRLQSTSISLLTVAGSTTIRALTFDFGGTENNGNLLTQTISGTGLSATLSQSYTYDGVNRLLTARESGSWSQGYCYDTVGNRGASGFVPNPDWTPNCTGQFTNNQWIRGSGDAYDGGNQKSVASNSSPNTASSTFTYDAENRMISANIANTGVVTYEYDGNGERVRKTVGGVITTYAYDAMGQLAAEYGGAASLTGTHYVTVDQLGSTRVATASNARPLESEVAGSATQSRVTPAMEAGITDRVWELKELMALIRSG